MLYTHAKFWTAPNGELWHALRREVPGAGVTDLSMGAVRNQRDLQHLRDWCAAHRLTVEDKIGAAS